METILKNNCVKIGYVQKPHGINGEIIIRFGDEAYETLEQEPVLLLEIDGLLVPFFIEEEGLRFKSSESVIAKIEWVDNEKKAKNLCGSAVYVAQTDWIESEVEANLSELVGYRLFDEKLGFIASIDEVVDYSGNLLLAVIYKGKEALVPFNEDLLVRFDENLKEIELRIPEGLFDLDEN
jgi:16S rRNA processing protein RimM